MNKTVFSTFTSFKAFLKTGRSMNRSYQRPPISQTVVQVQETGTSNFILAMLGVFFCMILYDFHDFRFANSLSDPTPSHHMPSPVSPVSPPRLLRDVEKSRCPTVDEQQRGDKAHSRQARNGQGRSHATRLSQQQGKSRCGKVPELIPTKQVMRMISLMQPGQHCKSPPQKGRKPSCAQLCKDKLGPEFPQSTRGKQEHKTKS